VLIPPPHRQDHDGLYFRRGSDSFLQPRQSMFSFAAAIRALCRRRPTLLTRKSARADRRLKAEEKTAMYESVSHD